MPESKSRWRMILAAPLLAALACGGSPASGATPSPGAGQLEKTTVTLGYGPYAGNDVAARLPEFAKKYGIEIVPTVVVAGPDLLTAMLTGKVEVGLVTYSLQFQALDRGSDVVAIANNVTGGTDIMTSSKVSVDPGDYASLRKLAQQRAASGKKLVLAASRPSINYAVGFLDLKKNGIVIGQDVEFRDVPNLQLLPQLLSAGEADLAIMSQPQAALAVAKGFAKTFSAPKGTANTEFSASRAFVTSYPKTARALVRAIGDTAAYLASHPDEHVRDVVKMTGVEETVARQALKDYVPDVRLDIDAAGQLAKLLFQEGLVKNDYSDRIKQYVLTDVGK